MIIFLNDYEQKTSKKVDRYVDGVNEPDWTLLPFLSGDQKASK